jgi:hypothetical protein
MTDSESRAQQNRTLELSLQNMHILASKVGSNRPDFWLEFGASTIVHL